MIVLANCNPVHEPRLRVLQEDLGAAYATTPTQLESLLGAGGVAKIFFYHWSWIIPASVHTAVECVLFHMTDLPYGRGGSPLQNLIVRGHEHTMMSALRVSHGLDTGPIYLKQSLALCGTAREIFLRAGRLMVDMTRTILETQPLPRAQEGEPTLFKRRKPADSDLAPLAELTNVYDHIRMLDADGYPPAFLETDHFRFEFTRAALHPQAIIADVRISKK